MNKRSFTFLCFFVFAILVSCTSEIKKVPSAKDGLIGTWKLISYTDLDSVTGQWKNTYGDHPKGYFTYTSSGIVNINASAETPLNVPNDSQYLKPITLGAVLDNAFAYFGTYSIDTARSVVTHHVKGGSVINYIGTDQHRQFIIRGDTLLIGDPRFEVGKRVLVREK